MKIEARKAYQLMVPEEQALWLESRAGETHPRPNGDGGYVVRVIRDLITREMEREAKRAKRKREAS